MDLSNSTFVQLTTQLNATVTADKAVVTQYSSNGGITWNTLSMLYHEDANQSTDNTPVQNIYEVPSGMQTHTTRIRMWQPENQLEGDAIWSVDDLYIGGERVAPLGIEGDFITALPPEKWPSHAGGVAGSSYCGRDGVILFSNSSSGLHHLATTFLDLAGGTNLIQFEVRV